MKNITNLAAILCFTLLGWQANAQNGGDDCTSAVMIDVGFFGNTTITDTNPGINNGDAAWFTYTAPANGGITIDSGINPDNLQDTRVFIYDNCDDLNELISDDDGGAGLASLISDFPVIEGTTYIISWDDRWSVDPFDWQLSFTDCIPPTAFTVEAGTTTDTGASFTWTDSATAVNGYELQIFLAGSDPTVDTPVDTQTIAAGIESATTTGLLDTTSYDAYLTGDCDGSFSAAVMTTFNTLPAPPVCGGQFFDTGGPDNDFMNDEDYQVTILPDNAGDVVTATFTFVELADGQFDTLTVDIGDGVFQIVPDVAAGDAPAIFTSIAADGALLFNFVSSGFGTNIGWEADITCGLAPLCPVVSNVMAFNTSDTEATVTWNDSPEATNGYIVDIFTAGSDPTTDTPVDTQTVAAGTLMASISNLMGLTSYDAYVTADCDADGLSDAFPVTFTTLGTPGPNGTCDTALVISPGMFDGQIVDANPGTDNGDSLWYSFTPGTDGDITISSCIGDDDDDTRVFLSEGPCDALVPVADDDDGCDAPNGFSSLIENVPVTAGTQYLIQWDDRWSTDEFDWELVFNSTGPECLAPGNLTVSNILDTTADLSWDTEPSAVDGYQTFVFLQGQDPQVDTPVYESGIIPQGTLTDTATGLSSEIAYDAYVASLCSFSSDPVITALSDVVSFNTILGIENSDVVSYTIHPNPATNEINLRAAFDIENIIVSNILGQQVLKYEGGSQELTLDVSSLQVGAYFIRATVNGIDVVEKLVKR